MGVNIPFELHLNNNTLNLTGVKDDDKFQWISASFFVAVNLTCAGNNLIEEVIETLINMVNNTNDARREINYRGDVFVVRPTD